MGKIADVKGMALFVAVTYRYAKVMFALLSLVMFSMRPCPDHDPPCSPEVSRISMASSAWIWMLFVEVFMCYVNVYSRVTLLHNWSHSSPPMSVVLQLVKLKSHTFRKEK